MSDDGDHALLGYIGRAELRYVIGKCPNQLKLRKSLTAFLRTVTDKAREARQLGPETLCEFLNENSSSTLEDGRIRNGERSEIDDPTTGSEQNGFLRPSWSTGTGLGTEDSDNELELDLLREEQAREGDINVLRLAAWVNQVSFRTLPCGRRSFNIAPQTPLTVAPQMPLEMVVQFFRRLG